MRILIAPDKFKGTLTQREACAAMRRGVERAARELGINVEIDECPVADGGEGTLEAIAGALSAEKRRSTVHDHVGVPALARWLLCDGFDGARTAFLEVAEVIGARSAASSLRNPERVDTEIVGCLIGRALDAGCGRIIVGLGGTLSVDGGIGVGGLTHAFLDGRGGEPPGYGATLAEIVSIRSHSREPRVREASAIALCDVQNPLLGPRGAARMFGPQKGATPEQVERLEAGLENLVRVCRACHIPCDPDQPGAGAAGGLGFGLATFLGAKLVPGAPYILDLLKFDERCAVADLVITGEGKMDMQTAEGKACAEVAKRAARAGKPCIAVVGTTDVEPETLRATLAARGILFQNIQCTAERATEPTAAHGSAAELEKATFRAMLDHLRK